eukprot:1033264-Amphidinium_carterae.2
MKDEHQAQLKALVEGGLQLQSSILTRVIRRGGTFGQASSKLVVPICWSDASGQDLVEDDSHVAQRHRRQVLNDLSKAFDKTPPHRLL